MNRRRPDGGFTLVETIVALGIVGTVMASLAVFFVRSSTTQHRQADTQVAAELAAGAMDYASQLPGDNILLGRTQSGVQAEWSLLSPIASTYLDTTRTQQAWQDPSLPASSAVQGLPTSPETVQLTTDSTPYQRWWYVGLCWQPTSGGNCSVVSLALQSVYVQMYRVVVVITWNAPDCGSTKCQYVATMLTESTLDDPTWQ